MSHCPPQLKNSAKEYWDKFAPMLDTSNAHTSETLAIYCSLLCVYWEQLSRGVVIKGLISEIRQLAKELGLSGKNDDEQEDLLTKFMADDTPASEM